MVKKELEEIYEEILPKLPLELRLKVLKGLKPEERLQGLKPEERLQGLSLEEIARALTPEQLEKLKTLPH